MTTIGIPIGLFVIVSAFVLTGIYVSKANRPSTTSTAESSRRAVMRMTKALLHVRDSRVASLPCARACGRRHRGRHHAADQLGGHRHVLRLRAVHAGITKWAASKTKSAADFYAAGGGITGFQNSLAIAGDYMSAASFLGISGLVFTSGYDGLIYSVGFLVGWPIVLFLIAERCATSASSPSPTSPPTACSRPRSACCRRAARWPWWPST